MKPKRKGAAARSRKPGLGAPPASLPGRAAEYPLHPRVDAWFTAKGWKPFSFQLEAVAAALAGRSGLIDVPTGLGKTMAAWLGPVTAWLQQAEHAREQEPSPAAPPLHLLWVTPLRALAQDTLRNLQESAHALGLPWEIGIRTGDTSSAVKARQQKRLPTALVTTPESLSLLLSYPETRRQFEHLQWVIVDEWHELMGSKRGVQTELGLARLRRWSPRLRTWGLSATLADPRSAMKVLLGSEADEGCHVTAVLTRAVEVATVLPGDMENFPWSGHLGLKLLPEVLRHIESARTTLLFTNTRSQTELWFRAVLEAKPAWSGEIGVHHGSIARAEREEVEQRLRAGTLRAVVCTSSLDLGVDFPPVDQVIQVGGPKGVARLLQRAGRSGHRPGATSRVVCVPTNAFELIEYAAAREAIRVRRIESRAPVEQPLDLLAQHAVTLALGGGFTREEFFDEVRSTHAFRGLTGETLDWVLNFVTRGGRSLSAYPEYCRVQETEGRYTVESRQVGTLHRLSIGTISSDQAVSVRYLNGQNLGSVEESFIGKVKPGGRFVFAGRVLELRRIHQMVAWVRPAQRPSGTVPVWGGGRSPLSSELADGVRELLEQAAQGRFEGAEMTRVRPVLEIQKRGSRLPTREELLIEATPTREGVHWFVFPFGGRLVHEGLAALVAYRLARLQPITATVSINDYGFELLPTRSVELEEGDWRRLLSPERLAEDLLGCVNATELANRQFRDIARVAGLVFQGFPGATKAARQLQASSGLLFEVFSKYEPDHLLLEQARREVLHQQLEFSRLQQLLDRIQRMRFLIVKPGRLTPMAFPLWAESIRGQVSSESWSDRVQQMAAELEAQETVLVRAGVAI